MIRPTAPTIALLTASILSGVIAGCHRRHPDPLAECRALLDLPRRNPVADADSAAVHGDLRVLVLGGYAAVAPGVDYYPVTLSPGKVGKVEPFNEGRPSIGGRFLRGTTDSETRACSALRSATMRYAFAYNRQMLSHLPKPGP